MSDDIRFEGLTLPVADVARSVAFYQSIGFAVEIQYDHFALVRLGTGTIGFLSQNLPDASSAADLSREQRGAFDVELSTDDLDGLYRRLSEHGIHFHEPPVDRGWERSMQCYDPDGYTVEFAEGRRGKRTQ